MMYICIGCKSWWIRTPLTRFYSPIEKSVRMKMSFYKLLIISNLWGYLTACHAGGREFEPRPHRWKRSLALAKLRFFVCGVDGAGSASAMWALLQLPSQCPKKTRKPPKNIRRLKNNLYLCIGITHA